MASRAIANLGGSSQAVGQLTPLHVFPVSTDWAQSHAPSANTKATKTQAAAGTNLKNVCTGLTVMLAAGSTAPSAVSVTVRLIDGSSGDTTYLWQAALAVPAVAGASSGIALNGLSFVGSVDTAMTLEFSAAGGANTVESVSFWGTTTA